MSTPSPPTFVLVPGHWHTATHLHPLTTALKNRGLPYATRQLHTVGRKPPGPRPCFSDDVSVIYTAVTTELLQGRDVVLVLHSYAGVPGAEAVNCLIKDGVVDKVGEERPDSGVAVPGHTTQNGDRDVPQSKRGRLLKVIFIAAYVFPAKMIIDPKDFVGPDNPGFSIDADNMTHMTSPWHYFFSDLPLSLAKPFVDACAETYYVGPMNITSENWRKARVSALLCTKDNAIPKARQEGTWKWLRERKEDGKGGEGDGEVKWVEACHAPWVSKAEEVADFLAKGVVGGKGKGKVGARVDGGEGRSGWA